MTPAAASRRTPPFAMALVGTKRPEQSRTFYRDTLNLSLIEDSPYAMEFDAHGTMLRIAKTQEVTPAPYAVFGLAVANVKEQVLRLKELKVEPVLYAFLEQDNDGIWTAPDGTQIFWFRDPDGNLLSYTQF